MNSLIKPTNDVKSFIDATKVNEEPTKNNWRLGAFVIDLLGGDEPPDRQVRELKDMATSAPLTSAPFYTMSAQQQQQPPESKKQQTPEASC